MKQSSPLAVAVAKSLREEIYSGVLPDGKPLPTERSLAEIYNVSRTVVRSAVADLADDGLISTGGGGRPVVTWTGETRRNEASDVGIWLWPYTEHYQASRILHGIQRELQGSSLRLVSGTASSDSWNSMRDSEAKFISDMANDSRAIGAILYYLGGESNLPVLQEARRKGLHLVFVDRRPPVGFEADFVGTENRGSARNVVKHLIELGHRRIVCVPNLDKVSSVEERVIGYRRALEDAGIEFDPSLIVPFEPLLSEGDTHAARRIVARALELKATALFAVNDNVALSIHEAAVETGIAVPQDLSIAGFDGVLRWFPGGGHLTTAVQDFSRIGEYAAELLLTRMREGASPSYRHVLLEAQLFVRNSTSPIQPDLAHDNFVDQAKELIP